MAVPSISPENVTIFRFSGNCGSTSLKRGGLRKSQKLAKIRAD
jgi:hypothetical protein